jgi:hypothetical protein
MAGPPNGTKRAIRSFRETGRRAGCRSRASSERARRTDRTRSGYVTDIAEIDGTRIRVRRLEAINDTPVLDIKAVLEGDIAER